MEIELPKYVHSISTANLQAWIEYQLGKSMTLGDTNPLMFVNLKDCPVNIKQRE